MTLSTACPKGTPRAFKKLQRRAEEARELRACYAAVDARDGTRCRVCRRRCSPQAIALVDRGERHHLTFRSRGGPHDTKNVLVICKATCHPAIHVTGTLRLSGDADLRDAVTGKLCGIEVSRLTETGWVVEKFC